MKFDKLSLIKNIVVFALLLGIGITFLISLEAITNIVIILFGIVLIVLGLKDIYSYCSENAEDAAQSSSLFTGITFILLGLLFAIGHARIAEMLSVYIRFAFGALMLLLGLSKLQDVVDQLRLHKSRWWIDAIVTAVILIIAVIVLLVNPGEIFIGIMFIVEAALVLAAVIVIWRLNSSDTPSQVEAHVVEEKGPAPATAQEQAHNAAEAEKTNNQK